MPSAQPWTSSLAWQQKLYQAGFSGRSWPCAYGGQDAPAWSALVRATQSGSAEGPELLGYLFR